MNKGSLALPLQAATRGKAEWSPKQYFPKGRLEETARGWEQNIQDSPDAVTKQKVTNTGYKRQRETLSFNALLSIVRSLETS